MEPGTGSVMTTFDGTFLTIVSDPVGSSGSIGQYDSVCLFYDDIFPPGTADPMSQIEIIYDILA